MLLQALQDMQAQGLVKGGTEGCAIVAYGDRWYDTEAVRFFDDEPVRHKLMDLMVCSRGACYAHILNSCSTRFLSACFAFCFISRPSRLL